MFPASRGHREAQIQHVVLNFEKLILNFKEISVDSQQFRLQLCDFSSERKAPAAET